MNPRQAKRIAFGLLCLNIILGLGSTTLLLYLAVDFWMTDLPKENQEHEPAQCPEKEENVPLEHFRSCWQANILEQRPEPTKAKKKDRPKTAVTKVRLPFSWVSVMVHSVKEKSFAVVQDERSGKQSLIREGQVIEGTSYQVISISLKKIKIAWDNKQCILEPPKPGGKKEERNPPINEAKNRWLGMDKH